MLSSRDFSIFFKAERRNFDASFSVIFSALKKMEKSLDESIDRLERLKRLGHPIREVEIKSAQDEKEALKRHLSKSRLRLDSIRLSAIGA